ncbi:MULTISPECIES: hypothetical protein [Nocardiopsidaceae]|uniref:Uncharacterized protein n=1 Tax=Streptomonospora nanhaiensis TaxID=1323731 RepID=A0ABY6YUX5_9ACTN|nr:hypothetical protein [Streptomonospora nanhaiensis]WAE75913.1 hypothetical protein OUQ99_12900 [Streptomonospora nanhaiensis]
MALRGRGEPGAEGVRATERAAVAEPDGALVVAVGSPAAVDTVLS